VDSKLRDNANTENNNKSLSTSKVPNIDFYIRSKATEWGEEDDHIQYIIENRKK